MQERLKRLKSHKQLPAWRWLVLALMALGTLMSLQTVTAGHGKEMKGLHPIMRVEPVYPTLAAEQGLEGSVVLEFDVEANGSVSNVKVVETDDPSRHFDRPAKVAVRQWLWEKMPNKVEGVRVQLDFVLGDDELRNSLAENESEQEQIVVSKR